MYISRLFSLFVVLIIAIFLFSCSSDDELPAVQNANMIGNVSIGEFDLSSGKISISIAAEDANGDLILDGLSPDNFEFTDLQVFPLDEDMPITPIVADISLDIINPDEEAPVSLVLSFDTSGSMTSNDPDRLSIEAGKSILERLRDGDQAAIVDFGGASADVIQGFTDDLDLLKEEIDNLRFRGATPMFDSIHKSIDLIEEINAENAAIVVLADGDNNRRPRDREEVVFRANENNIPIFTIALGDDLDFDDLIYFSDFTGGVFAEAAEADALEELFDGIGSSIFDGRAVLDTELFFEDDLPEAGQYRVVGTLNVSIGGNNIEIPVDFLFNAGGD